jgi:hypothetical protein
MKRESRGALSLRLVTLVFLASLSAACSSSATPPAPGDPGSPLPLAIRSVGSTAVAAARASWTNAPAASADSADNGGVPDQNASSYPAFAPSDPRLVSLGGPTLIHPKIVTVTWDGDGARGDYEAFGAGLGSSPYWATLHQFGIGDIVDGGRAHVTTPFDFTVDTLDAFVQANVSGAPQSGWPAYTPGTVYVLYVPLGATFTSGGFDYCGGVGFGYHTTTNPAGAAAATSVPYVVACGVSFGAFATSFATSELSGAVTNPFPLASPGIAGFDSDHAAFAVYESFQSEVGIACGFYEQNTVPPPPFDFILAPLWSNLASAAGTQPCTPEVPGDVYYNTTTFPGELEDIDVDLSATGVLGKVKTKGIKIPVGSSKTITTGFYSDQPTADWVVTPLALSTLPVFDASGNPIPNGSVDVSIDHPRGHNGHSARLTVTLNAVSPVVGATYIELRSGYVELGEMHVLPLFIAP